MKRVLFLFAVLLCFVGKAKAQSEIAHFAADPPTCDPTRGMLYYNTTSLVVKSCSAVNTWSTIGGGITSVSSLPATCTPGTTAPVNLSVPPYGIYICTATNTWSYASSDAGVIDPTSFGAKFDGKAFFSNVNTCSFTSGLATFTCTGANLCNGGSVACAAGQITDVGKQFTATVNGCCGVSFNFQGTLAMANVATTIISVQSATQATISQNFTTNSGANWIIAYGTNDDASLTAAETAWASGNKCKSIQLPAGITFVLQPHFTNPGANCLGMEPQADYTASVSGQGIGTTVIAMPAGYNFAGCTANTNTCFGGYFESTFNNFQLNGFGWGNTGAASLKNIMRAGLGSQWNQIGCMAIGGSDPNLNGVIADIGARFWGLSVDGCGGGGPVVAALFVNATIVKCYYCFMGDVLGLNLMVGGAGDFTDYGSDYGNTGGTTLIRVDGRYHGIGVNLFACSIVANATGINQSNGANSVVILDGARWNCTGTTSNGIFMSGAGQKLYLTGGTHVGGSTAAINNTAGTVYMSGDTVLDAGLLTGAAAGVFIADGHSLEGFCTGVGTAASTLALRISGTSTTGTGIPTTCTSTTLDAGIPITAPRTGLRLNVSSTAAGVNASSGVVTVLKNGGATTLTCTIGTGTTCIDTTHSVAFVNGDLISIQFTTQAADTLAGVKAQLLWQ